jgi:SAM-dependent methyltransferase
MTATNDDIAYDLPQPEYPPLQLTGERTLPGVSDENYWFQRHLTAYEFLLPFVRGKRVVDLGCGEGYGTRLLSSAAREAVGVDLAPEAIYHARSHYRGDGLKYEYRDIYDTQLTAGSFDVAVSLQVIEHMHEPDRFMGEIRRLLKPGGLCVITTPNGDILSPGCDQPINPFHIFEFDARGFEEFLGRFFPSVEVWGLFHAGMLYWHERLAVYDKYYWRFRMPARLNRLIYGRWYIPSINTRHFAWRPEKMEEAVDFMGFCFKEELKEEA